MAFFANYVTNPSFELSTNNWTATSDGSISRVGNNQSVGSYSARIRNDDERNQWGGAYIVVPIVPGTGPFSLSLYVTGATEEHGSSNSSGTRITVSDLLPGQNVGQAQQLKTQTFGRTTSGRVAVRNFTPRSTADRLVVYVETASTYFQDGGYSVSGPFTSYFSSESSARSFASGKYNATVDYDYPPPDFQIRWIVTYYNRTELPDTSGGLATVYVDAVKIEEGAVETGYVDGSFPGFIWDGAPHASATVNHLPLEMSGSGSLASPVGVEVQPVAFLEMAGSAELTGSLEMTAEGTVSASGGGESVGDLDVWLYGEMGASGAGGSVAEIVLYAIVPIEMSGAGGPGEDEYEPRVEMVKAVVTSASGAGSSTGSVELSFPQPISLSGSGSLQGSLIIDIGFQMSANGSGSLTGSLALDDAVPDGAFADFAIWSAGTTDQDPLQIGLGGGNAGTNSGASGQPWNRIWAEFIAPADQPSSDGYAWRRAAYAGVGFRFTSMPTNTYQELSCVQLEASTADDSPGPRTYYTAKTIRPLVHADRANYADPDFWTFFGSEGISVTDGDTSPIPNDPRPIQVMSVTDADNSGFFGANMVTPIPGTLNVASIYVKGSETVNAVEVKMKGANLDNIATSGAVALPADEWVRIVVPFVATDQDHFIAIEIPEVTDYPAEFYVCGYQVERGSVASEFMSFQAGTREYYYRDNGTDDTLGVYWYRDIDERIPLVEAALADHMPLSMRAGAPEFALVPHLDD